LKGDAGFFEQLLAAGGGGGKNQHAGRGPVCGWAVKGG
jgi:hypothetical protein